METKTGFTEAVDLSVPEAFSVHDANTANWVIRRIGEARQYAYRVRRWAATELRRAERQEQFFLQRYGVKLEDWARQQIAQQHDRRRSVNLPAGTIGFRVETTRLSIVNEQRLLAWAKQHLPQSVVTVETVAKTALTEHLKATGEIADGAESIGGGVRFYISAKNLDFVEGGQDEPAE